MSAFVISTDAMHRVVRGICAPGAHDNSQLLRTFGGISTTAPEAETQIGRLLFAMNVDAVTQRYPDCKDNPEDMPGEDGCEKFPETYTSKYLGVNDKRTDLAASLKSMECLEYQCSEGNVPESPLFKELEAAIGAVACAIVATMPEYAAASWG